MKTIRGYGLALLAALLAACPSLGWAVPVVTNGSFEADTWSPEISDLGGVNSITGWTAVRSPSNTFYVHGYNNAAEVGNTPFGNQFVVLGPTNVGGNYVEQAVSGFTIGATYTLSFGIASECGDFSFGCGAGPNPHARVGVSFPSGSSTPSADFLAPAAESNFWDIWATFTDNFVATSSTVEIRFLDLGGVDNGFDIGLDNISVSQVGNAVPEPGTAVLLVAEASALWLLSRRRRKA